MHGINWLHDTILVDATECPLSKPKSSFLATLLYSSYKKATTLKYEVALLENTCLPISISGPVVGLTFDILLFRSALKQKMIQHFARGIGDSSYQGEPILF